MAALEWDEEEIITRDKRWPPGTVDVTAQPVVRVIGLEPVAKPPRPTPSPVVRAAADERDRDEVSYARALPPPTTIDELVGELVGELVDDTPPDRPTLPRQPEPVAFDMRDTVPRRKKVLPPPLPSAPIDVEATVRTRRPFARDMLPESWSALPRVATPSERAPAMPPLHAEPAYGADSTWPPDPGSLVPHAIGESRRTLVEASAASSNVRWLGAAAVVAVVSALVTAQLRPKTGALHVELAEQSAVPIAAVFVDGIRRCDTTPCIISDVEPGERSVKIVAPDGAASALTSHAVTAGRATRLTLTLDLPPAPPKPPTLATVSLASTTPDVRVAVDGVAHGALPITLDDLAAGTHTLRFEAERFEPLERSITVSEGENVSIDDVALALVTGVVTIDVKTPGARVLLGHAGTQYGRQPLYGPWPKQLELAADRAWEIVAARPGFKPRIIAVAFDARGEQHIDVALEALTYVWDGDIYE